MSVDEFAADVAGFICDRLKNVNLVTRDKGSDDDSETAFQKRKEYLAGIFVEKLNKAEILALHDTYTWQDKLRSLAVSIGGRV